MPDAKHTVTRRGALGLLGAVGATPLLGSAAAHAAPLPAPTLRPAVGGATPVQGLHLTFGNDPARQMVASWLSDGPVARPRMLFGSMEEGLGSMVPA